MSNYLLDIHYKDGDERDGVAITVPYEILNDAQRDGDAFRSKGFPTLVRKLGDDDKYKPNGEDLNELFEFIRRATYGCFGGAMLERNVRVYYKDEFQFNVGVQPNFEIMVAGSYRPEIEYSFFVKFNKEIDVLDAVTREVRQRIEEQIYARFQNEKGFDEERNDPTFNPLTFRVPALVMPKFAF